MSTCSQTTGVGMGGVVALCATLMCVGVAQAQGVGQPPNYAWEWATVTHPGNAPISEAQTPGWVFDDTYFRQWSGTVNYEYRIAKTEVTCSQYAEFLNAYAQAFNFSSPTSSVRGDFLQWQSNGPGQPAHYRVPQGFANVAINPSGRMAFRMANWLHNNKGTGQESFLTGAYDIPSVLDATGAWTSIPGRMPGARYWIPSNDEWAKAVYYDPNRYGLGQEGYWQYPNSSDSPLIEGLFRNGGQTLAGVTPGSLVEYQNVGIYTSVTTPWGLLDASGGWREWTDTPQDGLNAFAMGSNQYGPNIDRLDDGIYAGGAISSGQFGFRFASVIPSAGTAALLTAIIPYVFTRRTRR